MAQRPRTLTDPAVLCRSSERDSILRPARVDELLDLRGHLDLRRPLAGALERPLARRVDAELAAIELPRRRVIEVIEWAFSEQYVALRVEVRADVEHHVVVVVHVHVLIDDDDRLRQREHAEA